MIGKTNNMTSFGSNVILHGMGSDNYKKINIPCCNKQENRAIKKAIKNIMNNKIDDTVSITYDAKNKAMNMEIEQSDIARTLHGGPLYFLPKGSSIEWAYKHIKNFDMEPVLH